eukprot:scaffold410_cov125-Isochrysis_galbana.AAC.7
MGGTAHQLTAADGGSRSMPGPARHPDLSGTQQHSGTSNPGRPARAVSHPTLNLRKAFETRDTRHSRPNLTLPLTLYAPASHVLRRPEVPEGILRKVFGARHQQQTKLGAD